MKNPPFAFRRRAGFFCFRSFSFPSAGFLFPRPQVRTAAKGGGFLFYSFLFLSADLLFSRTQVRTAAKGEGSLFYSFLFLSADLLFSRPQVGRIEKRRPDLHREMDRPSGDDGRGGLYRGDRRVQPAAPFLNCSAHSVRYLSSGTFACFNCASRSRRPYMTRRTVTRFSSRCGM